jgi:sec-independent protein translocase protein TatA
MELAVVLIIALVIFGPKRLPHLGRSMGQGMREFKQSLSAAPDAEQAPQAAISSGTASNSSAPGPLEAASDEAVPDTAGPATEKPAEPVEGEVVAENKA